MKTDIDIAREAKIQSIQSIAAKLGIEDKYLEQYGKFKAKIDLSIIQEKLQDTDTGKLIFIAN